MKENISIFKPKIARDLLKQGFTIVDIKPCKENTDRSIFIFKNTEELQNYLYKNKET